MTGVQTRRTETGYKAAAAGAIEHEIETPDTRSDCVAVNPAGPEPRTHNLPWEVRLAVHGDYRTGNGTGERDGSQPRP